MDAMSLVRPRGEPRGQPRGRTVTLRPDERLTGHVVTVHSTILTSYGADSALTPMIRLVLSLFWTKNKKPTFCMILGHCLIVYCCLFAAEKVICHNCILIFLSDMDHGEHISIKILKYF
jgi:hypothetical protein